MLTIENKKKINLTDLLIPALLVLLLTGTIIERHWIKPLALAIAGYLAILIYAPKIILVMNYRKILFTFNLLFITGVYAFIYSPFHQSIKFFPVYDYPLCKAFFCQLSEIFVASCSGQSDKLTQFVRVEFLMLFKQR